MKKLLGIILLVGICGVSSAGAQEGPCAGDIQKFCPGVEQGEGRIAKCLKEHRSELSPECKAKGKEMKSEMKDFKAACESDVQQFCKDVKHGQGRVMKCLKSHSDQLSAPCKDAMTKMKGKAKRAHA